MKELLLRGDWKKPRVRMTMIRMIAAPPPIKSRNPETRNAMDPPSQKRCIGGMGSRPQKNNPL